MSELDTELDRLRRERSGRAIAVKGQQSHYAELLKGGMGQEMKDVLSGKKKIRQPKSNGLKIFFNKLWNLLSIQKR